ncbi:uncharacterized protein SOCE836_024660 [Sorangium cellulosum]|uniref:Uncharacterized protein n=1 Tax=Sorangium cellulosum TaxID=56 RepID=A0A4P2QLK0_SORCE|nr:uncharacterized protein SOCE836_024660 [Sorangium cellulosum]WCQ89757.1 hypothetical protein NQZ70_02449 [Sorangium sp. Soce836]
MTADTGELRHRFHRRTSAGASYDSNGYSLGRLTDSR